MGHLHDNVSIVVPFTKYGHSAGTWTNTVASNVWYNRRTAADAAATSYIPLCDVPQRDGALKGAMLNSVNVHFRIVTGAIDAMEAHLYKATMAADGSLLTVAEVTTSYDTGHDTAAERIDVDEHKMTLTVTTPTYLEDNEMLFVEVVWDGSATGVIDEFFTVGNWTQALGVSMLQLAEKFATLKGSRLLAHVITGNTITFVLEAGPKYTFSTRELEDEIARLEAPELQADAPAGEEAPPTSTEQEQKVKLKKKGNLKQ